MNRIEVREISESDAAELVAARFKPDEAVAQNQWPFRMALGRSIARTFSTWEWRCPQMEFQMLDATVGLIYVTEGSWPGSGIYRVTVTDA